MDLPRQKWYTVEELAEYWKVKSELVRRYIEMGQLVSSKFLNAEGDEWNEDYIMLEEVERFEKQEEVGCPEKEHGQASISAKLAEVLNPNHPWHSENLALAVKAWLELYATRAGNKGDNACKPTGGNTKLIGDWLKINAKKDMGTTTEEHFRVIINPSKQGGPQKISE